MFYILQVLREYNLIYVILRLFYIIQMKGKIYVQKCSSYFYS